MDREIIRIKEIVWNTMLKYSPTQPRDSWGRWTSGFTSAPDKYGDTGGASGGGGGESITDSQRDYVSSLIAKPESPAMFDFGTTIDSSLQARRIYFDDGSEGGRQPSRKRGDLDTLGKTYFERRENYYKSLDINRFSKTSASSFIDDYKRLGRDGLFLERSGIKTSADFAKAMNQWAGVDLLKIVGGNWLSMAN